MGRSTPIWAACRTSWEKWVSLCRDPATGLWKLLWTLLLLSKEVEKNCTYKSCSYELHQLQVQENEIPRLVCAVVLHAYNNTVTLSLLFSWLPASWKFPVLEVSHVIQVLVFVLVVQVTDGCHNMVSVVNRLCNIWVY
jgi:hypothetical protein